MGPDLQSFCDGGGGKCTSAVDDVVHVLALLELRVLLVSSSVLIVEAVYCVLAGDGGRLFLARSSGRSLPLFARAVGDFSRDRSNLYIILLLADSSYSAVQYLCELLDTVFLWR